jgi:hypothetical protein
MGSVKEEVMLSTWLLDRRAFLKMCGALSVAPVLMRFSPDSSARRLTEPAILNGNQLWVGERFRAGERILDAGKVYRVRREVAPGRLIVA